MSNDGIWTDVFQRNITQFFLTRMNTVLYKLNADAEYEIRVDDKNRQIYFHLIWHKN